MASKKNTETRTTETKESETLTTDLLKDTEEIKPEEKIPQTLAETEENVLPEEASEIEEDNITDPEFEEEPVIKQNFGILKIRALRDNGEPFTGAYGTIHFDTNGDAEIGKSDSESLEKLTTQFPSLKIEQI